MRFWALVSAALVLVLAGSPAAAFAASPPAASAASPPAASAASPPAAGVDAPGVDATAVDSRAVEPPSHPNLTIVVELHADGNASWTVTTYVPLEGANDTASFRRQASRWEAGTLDVGYSAALFRRYAGLASNATGRPMRVPEASVDREAELVHNGSLGAYRLSFTWTNFGRRDGDRLVVDAFRTGSGSWLPRLYDGQRLVIRPPEGSTFQEAPPGARLENRTLVWDGPTAFEGSGFAENPVVFVASEPPTPGDTPSPAPPGPLSSRSLWLGAGAVALLGGGLALFRWLGDGRAPDEAPGGPGEAPDDPGDDVPASADAGTVEAAGGNPGTEAAEAGDEPTPEDPFAGIDEELLSDEERVLRLLEANGGRMKQARIVEETDWSNAKVSQLLSSMDDDGAIDKLRIGRENLISLPDVDLDGVER